MNDRSSFWHTQRGSGDLGRGFGIGMWVGCAPAIGDEEGGAAVFVRTGRLKRPWEWAVDKAVKGKVFKVT